jgi:hypothetical protein
VDGKKRDATLSVHYFSIGASLSLFFIGLPFRTGNSSSSARAMARWRWLTLTERYEMMLG